MMFDNEINENEMKDMSVSNFLSITNKAYNLYLNQEIEDLDITTEQIPFIIELDKKESISRKDLANYLFLNDKNTARGLFELYRLGIIDKKQPNVSEMSNENKTNKNKVNKNKSNKNIINESNGFDKASTDENQSEDLHKNDNNNNNNFEFNHYEKLYGEYRNPHLEILLTSYGKEIAKKIKEIDAKWEELIYKNLESSNKDEIMKNVKDLAISSLKTNKDTGVSTCSGEISRARKFFDKMLGKMFSRAHYKSQKMHNPDIYGRGFNDCNRGRMDHMHHPAMRRSGFDDCDMGKMSDIYSSDMYGHRFDDENMDKMNKMHNMRNMHYMQKRMLKESMRDDAFRYMAYVKAKRLNEREPFFR